MPGIASVEIYDRKNKIIIRRAFAFQLADALSITDQQKTFFTVVPRSSFFSLVSFSLFIFKIVFSTFPFIFAREIHFHSVRSCPVLSGIERKRYLGMLCLFSMTVRMVVSVQLFVNRSDEINEKKNMFVFDSPDIFWQFSTFFVFFVPYESPGPP